MNDYTQAIENLSNSQNCVQIFENAELGSVRTLCIDGEPWFVGKDVADVLGYTNSRKALVVHVVGESFSGLGIPKHISHIFSDDPRLAVGAERPD